MKREDHLKTLGAHIRQIRESFGVTQDEMAHKAGFARSYYSGVERGVRNISAANLIRLAFAMDIEVGDLFPDMSHLK